MVCNNQLIYVFVSLCSLPTAMVFMLMEHVNINNKTRTLETLAHANAKRTRRFGAERQRDVGQLEIVGAQSGRRAAAQSQRKWNLKIC